MSARAIVACVALVMVASVAGAQDAAMTACKVDTNAEWYRSQAAYHAQAGEAWSNDSMRTALLKAAGFDAHASFVPELGWRVGASIGGGGIDSGAINLLRGMARQRQWPTRALVGVAGVHAAWLIAQHDSTLAIAAQRRMMEGGPGEASPAEVAVLEDMRRISIGRGQIHGTQFTRDGDRVMLAGRLEDSVHVDMRREGAWLPPLSVSACLAKAAR